METKKIVLDTNFLLIPGTLKVDIFSEIKRICDFSYKLYVIDKTVTELEEIIASQKKRYANAAKMGLELIRQKKVETIKTDKPGQYADKVLVGLAQEGHIIASQDKALKLKIKSLNGNIIFLKQKKYLALQ